VSALPPSISQRIPANYRLAHGDTVFVQSLVADAHPTVPWPRSFAYPPCWAILEPGMALEAHQHPTMEAYVFVAGAGTMRLDGREFPVAEGVAVIIPPNAVHQVCTEPGIASPLVWISLGWHVTPEES
jgi:mannose-6-phosphate isomerase-like protein (cupin superfamily)